MSKCNQSLAGRKTYSQNICMKIGYARISTVDQKANFQKGALKASGCERVVTDQVSGASAKRPKLDKLLSGLQAGDVLTVWRLDRLGRSLPHLIEVVRDLEAKGAPFQSLSEVTHRSRIDNPPPLPLIRGRRQCLGQAQNMNLNRARS